MILPNLATKCCYLAANYYSLGSSTHSKRAEFCSKKSSAEGGWRHVCKSEFRPTFKQRITTGDETWDLPNCLLRSILLLLHEQKQFWNFSVSIATIEIYSIFRRIVSYLKAFWIHLWSLASWTLCILALWFYVLKYCYHILETDLLVRSVRRYLRK